MTAFLVHLLNGDSTRVLFEQAGISGETAVWREVICEGETPAKINLQSLRQLRSSMFEAFVGQGQPGYHTLVIKELQGFLEMAKKASEIVLWFEYDLFCQLNMVAAINFLQQNVPALPRLSLVCTGDWPGAEKRLGLGELPADQYPSLLEKRQLLSRQELEFCADYWQAYCSENPKNLLPLLDRVPEVFVYLAEATEVHFSRFPSLQNGLNVIEQRILRAIAEGFNDFSSLMRHLLLNQGIFGFGDLQYRHCLVRLAPLLTESKGRYQLNETGKSVLAMQQDFLSVRPEPVKLGGCLATEFRYDVVRHHLV